MLKPEECPHQNKKPLDAIGIERYKCLDCDAVLYDEGDGIRFYRCSYTAWGYCERHQKRRRKRCCSEIPTQWYQDAAYCLAHRPTSRYVQDEKEWREVVRRVDAKSAEHLAWFDKESAKIRAEASDVRPLPVSHEPVAPASASSGPDHREIKW